jgi:hypothetical protein
MTKKDKIVLNLAHEALLSTSLSEVAQATVEDWSEVDPD